MRRVEAIVVTHTHRDHTDGVEALRAMTNARVIGCAPHEGTPEADPLEGPIEPDGPRMPRLSTPSGAATISPERRA